MSKNLIPNPKQYRSLNEWAMAVHRMSAAPVRINVDNDPLPVLLPHRTGAKDERATTDGILLYDPDLGQMVMSKAGLWVPIALDTP